MFRTVLFCFLVSLYGCSTAGPFVTHLYPSGPDKLTQQKCMVHFNAFTGIVSTGQCSTADIVLVH
jgi:type IV secretion system protein VirB7